MKRMKRETGEKIKSEWEGRKNRKIETKMEKKDQKKYK